MLFILPDFLKASTPAVSSKYFHPPPPAILDKKSSRGVTRVSLLHWMVDNDQSKLAYYSHPIV